MNLEWSKEYCGVQYLHPFPNDRNKTYVDVTNFGSWAELSVWFPGCKFSPRKQSFRSVAAAKIEGEMIILAENNLSIWNFNNGHPEVVYHTGRNING